MRAQIKHYNNNFVLINLFKAIQLNKKAITYKIQDGELIIFSVLY